MKSRMRTIVATAAATALAATACSGGDDTAKTP